MLLARVRYCIALFLCTLLLGACGGGGGDPGTGTPPATATGSLQVQVTGLPAGTNAAIRITGPGNFSQDVSATQTLNNLVPGSYSIAATSITVGNTTYAATPATQTLVVTTGASSTASIVYASSTLTLALADIGPSFTNPTFASAPPGDERLFVVERRGVIRIVQRGAVLTQPWLDISAAVFTGGEGGLLSMAFDPNFATNGYFYVYYTDLAQNIVVARYASSPVPNQADPSSGLTILRIAHATYTNHFGGLVAFGPDGMLYVGTGDGGGAGDPLGNAQNLDSLLGKLLRVDVRTASSAQPYTIAPGNPYPNQAGRRPEIWAAGLRNPWRYAFDGSDIYIADVGQGAREEINRAGTSQGGLNYGWNILEGSACYNAASCARSGLTLPVFEYEHGAGGVNGCSITGGYVYRGTAIPELAGRYFYSDYCRGFIKSIVAGASGVVEERDWNINTAGQVVSFGRDGAGELLVISASGRIWRLVRGS